MSGSRRIHWIDVTRGTGILLIVLGHSIITGPMNVWLFSFHVPLFFILAGYMFNPNGSLASYARKKARTLLLPYLTMSLTFFAVWIVFWEPVYRANGVASSPLNLAVGILYGVGSPTWMQYDIPLWFLPCLFLTEMLFFYLHRRLCGPSPGFWMGLAAVGFLGFLSYAVPQYLLWNGSITHITRPPWSLDTAFTGAALMGFGYAARAYNLMERIQKRHMTIPVIIVLFLTSLLSMRNGRIDMNSNFYGNIFLFYLGALSGSGLVFTLARSIGKMPALEWFGRHAIIILGFHMAFITTVSMYILGLMHGWSVWYIWLVFFVVATAGSALCAIIIDKIVVLRHIYTGR